MGFYNPPCALEAAAPLPPLRTDKSPKSTESPSVAICTYCILLLDEGVYPPPYTPRMQFETPLAVDIFSIKPSKLFGARDSLDDSFDSMGFDCHPKYGKNKGDLLTAATYMVSAEVPVVVRELFDSKYTKIIPGLVNETPALSANGQDSADFAGLSSYPLSGYNVNWGWGLHGSSWSEISKYYEFYSYVPSTDNEQVHGVIDWSNSMTTLKETVSTYTSWTEKNGTVDMAFDYKLREGLGLFTTTDPNYTGEEDRIINIKEV